MSRWILFIAVLVVSALSGACSLITGLDGRRDVQVRIDPTVEQRVIDLATGDTIYDGPPVKPQQIPCFVASPRTCAVREFIHIEVINDGARPVTYQVSCPLPYQRRHSGAWEWLWPISVCSAIGLPQFEIPAGDRAVFELPFWSPLLYDWRAESEELRVVLELVDEDGELPLEMRASAPFQLEAQLER